MTRNELRAALPEREVDSEARSSQDAAERPRTLGGFLDTLWSELSRQVTVRHHEGPVRSLPDDARARFAYNQPHSQSGRAAAQLPQPAQRSIRRPFQSSWSSSSRNRRAASRPARRLSQNAQ